MNTTSAAALSGSFAPAYRFENLEIRKGFLQFPNLNLEQNPSLTALAIESEVPYNGQTELLATSTNAAGRQTTYEYYLSSGRAKSTYQSGVVAISYTYSGGRLSQHQYYNFAYNVWGQTTATKVGSRTLSTNTYYNCVNDDTARGGNLKSTTYANGDSVSYTYGQPVRQGTD